VSDKTLTIVLFTYSPTVDGPRAGYALRTLRSVLDNLKTTATLKVHIADDGSAPGHVENLRALAGSYGQVLTVGSTNADRQGYGASYNLATQATHSGSDYILPLEDDWELPHPLYVDRYLDALDRGIFGCIRLGYLGVTQTLEAHVVKIDSYAYWLLHPDSAEPHLFAGHPRLETVGWQRQMGAWEEGLEPGPTEWSVAMRVRDGIVWPADGGHFAHIGTIQARTDQSEYAS
jgi:GT2 family glycosyltransferase